jgi:hypothetical protein
VISILTKPGQRPLKTVAGNVKTNTIREKQKGGKTVERKEVIYEPCTLYSYAYTRPCGHKHTCYAWWETESDARFAADWSLQASLCETCNPRPYIPPSWEHRPDEQAVAAAKVGTLVDLIAEAHPYYERTPENAGYQGTVKLF